ncbi:HAD family hydrolase [Acinetobacter shaoyimingii]|uniref:HAD family hydrolase n=1 Tax=Acinetobacter shaoyimingii TaxID=2715164 RepID=A0A6G8RTI6_9GAMM|nr:HAD family hydrolase [Acinetobacter shaoyimingii]NHB59401.1 HAD family hydrolase [Acinetobacter shaoyimingii]QIO05187.1 HAD family hydrolase [Acinetobacter shaoyimingii]
MIKNILIDLDGTLTDPKVGITASARFGLNKVGHPIPEDENIDWIIGPPLKASLAKLLNVDAHDVLAEQALQGYRERFATVGLFENHLFEDVPETLKQLKAQGYRLFLATAKPEVYARQILEHFDLLQYFEYPYGSELNGERTNKADLIAFILEKEQLDPNECIMVGDREHDILGARKNGIETIAVEYGYGSDEELTVANPKARIQNFFEILDHLN